VTHGRIEMPCGPGRGFGQSHASGSPILDTTAGDLCARQLPACSRAVLRP
jgi:hypothetical protein